MIGDIYVSIYLFVTGILSVVVLPLLLMFISDKRYIKSVNQRNNSIKNQDNQDNQDKQDILLSYSRQRSIFR